MTHVGFLSISCITFGVPFPWDLEHIDQMWSYAFDDQPDYDVVLYAQRLSEDSFISWFNYSVYHALLKTKSCAHKYSNEKSRAEMLLAIIDGDNHLLEQLPDLFITVAVVAFEGARVCIISEILSFTKFCVRIYPTFLGEQPRQRDNLLESTLAELRVWIL